jgi:hypothetical protein
MGGNGGLGGGGGIGSSAGAPNTGGGGAGAQWGGDQGGDAGNGGSGIVIIRYPDTFPAAAATTGSPTVTVTGGYRIYKWTTVGTWSVTF